MIHAYTMSKDAHFAWMWVQTKQFTFSLTSLHWKLMKACSVTSGDAKPKYSQSHVPPAKLQVRKRLCQSKNVIDCWSFIAIQSRLIFQTTVVFTLLHWHMSVCYLRMGASGESLGATPLATEARNSCLFCCTRQAARMILWHGVRR